MMRWRWLAGGNWLLSGNCTPTPTLLQPSKILRWFTQNGTSLTEWYKNYKYMAKIGCCPPFMKCKYAVIKLQTATTGQQRFFDSTYNDSYTEGPALEPKRYMKNTLEINGLKNRMEKILGFCMTRGTTTG